MQNCVVFILSENLHNKLIKFYDPFKCDKFPPYSKFQAKNYDVTITLYESGKVMFQGIGADIEASIWIDAEKRLNNKVIDLNKKDKKEKSEEKEIFFNTSTIGSDETGCGDFFGPIVVAASFVSFENIKYLKELGVKDSKKITDDKILKIAPEIMKNIPHTIYILDNKTYNKDYKNINMVELKCLLHNKVLCNLIDKYNPEFKCCIVDKFVNGKKYFEYLKNEKEVFRNIYFYTKGEDKCMAVAAASIIARFTFIKEMDKISEKMGFTIPKGAGVNVDDVIKKIIDNNQENVLNEIGKLDFKNYTKLK